MPFPTTKDGLVKADYEPPKKSTKCTGCGAEIEFWRTPTGKFIPLDSGTLVAHWGTCPKADEFRKKNP
jgi:hypothetical protein